MDMPGRLYNAATGYRYGFNGKEKENDPVQYDYGFRIYDARLMRFKSVDPLTKSFPWYTPYQFAGNKPIWASDLDGLEEWMRTQENLLRQRVRLQQQAQENQQKKANQQALQAMAQQPTIGPANTDAWVKTQSQYAERQHQMAKSINGATMDGLAASMYAPVPMAASKYVLNTTDHAYGVYAGIKDKEYASAGKNAVLFALDVAPFAVQGVGALAARETVIPEAFASGGTKLMSTAQINKFPQSLTYGAPSETFISSTSEVNALFKQGLSRAQIGERLGITDPAFLKGDLIRIDISKSALKNLNLRSTTGSEVGANELFKIGGRTSGGVTEGVVDGIPKNGTGVTTTTVKYF